MIDHSFLNVLIFLSLFIIIIIISPYNHIAFRVTIYLWYRLYILIAIISYIFHNRKIIKTKYLNICGMYDRSFRIDYTCLHLEIPWWFAISRIARYAAESSMRRGTAVDVNEPIERTGKRCRRLAAPLRVRWRASAARLAVLHARFFLHVLLSRRDVRSRFSLSLLGRRDLLTRHGASVQRGYARWESQTSARKTRESITPCIFTHNSEHEWLMKNIWIKRTVLTCRPVIVGLAPMLNHYSGWRGMAENDRQSM